MSTPAPDTRIKAAVVPVTPFEQNCSLIWDEATKRGAVVDPGGDVERIEAAIAQVGLTVEKIVLTHGHIDHAGGAAALKEALEQRLAAAGEAGTVPVEGPDPRDRFLLEGLAAQGRAYGVVDARDLVPDRWLEEGGEVEIAGHAFKVLHGPGHTPGHLVFVSTSVPFALVGDVLFRGTIGRTDFPYGDHDALLRAIRDKLLPLADDVSFLCGHGPGSTIGEERRSNPFLRGLGAT
jgi:glyoxylase-like metal-dependent hydrolase (beta-lactamase superfamily II)